MKKLPTVHQFDKMPMERLNDQISRRFISGENLTLVCFEFKKGALVPTHHHPNEQMSYVIKGKMKVTVEGTEFVVGKGEMIHILPEVGHQFEAMEESTVLDLVSPARKDWVERKDGPLRK